MSAAEEIQPVNARLVFWQAYDPAVKVDLSSHALLTDEGWLLIDPIPLEEGLLEELQARKNIAAIILTSANHERASAVFKKKCGVPVIAHREAAASLAIAPDQLLDDGSSIHGLAVIHLPGFAPGEIALHLPAHGGLMIMGDALINLQPDGLRILPHKYCADPKAASKSLQKLLQFPFESMTFAHGLPIVGGARGQLLQILQRK